MSWDIKKLNECCISIADGDHLPPPKSETGVPFVTIANVDSYNHFDFTDTMFVPQSYYDKLDNKRKARKGDILLTVVGSFGIPILITDDTPFVFQRHIAILRPDPKVIDSRFLYYTMLSKSFYAQADAYAIGAAQRTISLTSLRQMKVAVPDLDTQEKIADALSLFDNLIDNNNKQIKSLEQMAENLYKEWFVRFRFPGYENAKFENGIPVGWEIKKIGKDNLLPIITGKKDANYGDEGGEYTFFTCAQKAILAPDYSFDQSAIILAGNGDLSVKLFKGKFEAYQRVYVLTPYNLDYLNILYYVIKDELKTLTQGASGSTIRFITKGMIERISTVIPNETILRQFNEIVDDIYEQKTLLEKANNNLIKQRDLLLPRLMSGKLEV